MKIDIISFTDRGKRLADLLADRLKTTHDRTGTGSISVDRELYDDVTSVRCGAGMALREWAERAFASSDALIYVGAAGICVRSIAPHIQSKTTDPAVVVVDETGKYAIPVLSGHLGGANDLARTIAAITGGEAVITTATDRNNVFSVDAWARIQGCAVENPGKIKDVSMKILDGRDIVLESDFPIEGSAPEHVILRYSNEDQALARVTSESGESADGENGPSVLEEQLLDAVLTIRARKEDTPKSSLRIIPRIVCAGVGCRKGIPAQNVENAIRAAFVQAGLSELALCGIFSIDLKKEEEGLLEFCRRRKVPFVTFSSEQLDAVPGDYTSSAFVREVAGVDNVCERSAVLGAEKDSESRPEQGSERRNSGTSYTSDSRLILRKYVCEGVTVALAVKAFHPDFRWTRG